MGDPPQGRPRKYIPEHLFKNCLWRHFQQIFFNFFCDFRRWLLVRSFQDFFCDICSRCWWNRIKNISIQNIKILFPEQCVFYSKCCGSFDSYVWVAYFSKAFGIFQWISPTRFVGDNLWEIPPKKAYGNLFHNMFKELFLDIFPRNIIQHFWLSLLKLFLKKLWGNTWSMS